MAIPIRSGYVERLEFDHGSAGFPAMTDVSETDRGWQNVARYIRTRLQAFAAEPDEPPLTEIETAEQAAWQTAHTAVVDRMAERMEGDGSEG